MKKVLALVFALVFVLSLAACGSKGDNSTSGNEGDNKTTIIGTWTSDSESKGFSSVTFNSDGTGSLEENIFNTVSDFEYTDNGNKGDIYDIGGQKDTSALIWKYTISGDTLTLIDSEDSSNTYTFTKAE